MQLGNQFRSYMLKWVSGIKYRKVEKNNLTEVQFRVFYGFNGETYWSKIKKFKFSKIKKGKKSWNFVIICLSVSYYFLIRFVSDKSSSFYDNKKFIEIFIQFVERVKCYLNLYRPNYCYSTSTIVIIMVIVLVCILVPNLELIITTFVLPRLRVGFRIIYWSKVKTIAFLLAYKKVVTFYRQVLL